MPPPRLRGTAEAYTIGRLKRDAEKPDDPRREEKAKLVKQVLSGEVSANKAAIQAGYRQSSFQCSHNPAAAARVLRRHFSGEQLAELIRLLQASLARARVDPYA